MWLACKWLGCSVTLPVCISISIAFAYARRNPTFESAKSSRLGLTSLAQFVRLRVALTQGVLHMGYACCENRSKRCLQAPASSQELSCTYVDVAPRLKTILILLHNKVPATHASRFVCEAQGMMDCYAWVRLTAAFAVVTELFIKDDKLLVCSKNEAAVSTAVSVIARSST